jgi:hypothetical protein
MLNQTCINGIHHTIGARYCVLEVGCGGFELLLKETIFASFFGSNSALYFEWFDLALAVKHSCCPETKQLTVKIKK